MDKIAVFANDLDHARHILEPMLGSGTATHWIVVACPPTFSRHIGRWVSQQARTQWRERWSADLFEALEPLLKAQPGSRMEKMMARRPLTSLCERLQTRQGPLRLLDARRPKLGKSDEPLTPDQPGSEPSRWAAPVAITTGLSAVLALTD
jgi:hypothetical protein